MQGVNLPKFVNWNLEVSIQRRLEDWKMGKLGGRGVPHAYNWSLENLPTFFAS